MNSGTGLRPDARVPEGRRTPKASPARKLLAGLLLGIMFALSGRTVAGPAAAGTNQFVTEPISLTDAVNIALQQSPAIRKAQKDVEATHGVVIQTRAIAIPKVQVTGHYAAVQPSDVDKLTGQQVNVPLNIPFGTDQSWVSQIRLVQSLYEGGRVISGLRVAELTRAQSLLNYQTTVADSVLETEIAYYDVLLNEQQIIVQEASVQLLTRELSETTKRYNAGTVPRFNVLRAEVELANAQPKLIRARNAYRIAKNNLANVLGFNVPKETFEDIPLKLSGKLEAEPLSLELPRAINLALERRTELGALRKGVELRAEDIVNARAGILPSLQAYGGYDAHSSLFDNDLTRRRAWMDRRRAIELEFVRRISNARENDAGAGAPRARRH